MMGMRALKKIPVILVSGFSSPALAGMPMGGLSDVSSMRLSSISFFLVAFLVLTILVKVAWNFLAKDFEKLPRLTFGKALGLVFLWGLLFNLVLVMISGARELMTPGAWEKNGATYQLKDPSE